MTSLLGIIWEVSRVNGDCFQMLQFINSHKNGANFDDNLRDNN